MSVTIREVPLQDAGATPAPLMVDLAGVLRRELVAVFGHDDLADSPEVLTRALAEQRYRRKLALVALDGDRPVGGGWFRMPLQDNTHVVEGQIAVDPEADAADVVPAVWESARAAAVADGRSVAMLWSAHRPLDGEGEHLVPRTGVSRLPMDGLVRALSQVGFALEQVEQHSVLDVAEGLARAEAELPAAREASGTAYRVLGWTGPTPEEHLEGMAGLMARMSTDVPAGALQIEAEEWDAERVADRDRIAVESGRALLTTVAQHVATGALAAYTVLELPQDRPQVGFQEDTLVHADHRGHRLGMLVKALNLQRLAEHAPQVRRLHTWNAGENRHMLAINVALGFRERGAEGAWQQTDLR